MLIWSLLADYVTYINEAHFSLQSIESNLGVTQTLFSDSRWLVDRMVELGFSRSLSEWIGSNLKRSGDSETWTFNLDGAVQMFNSYRFISLPKNQWLWLYYEPSSRFWLFTFLLQRDFLLVFAREPAKRDRDKFCDCRKEWPMGQRYNQAAWNNS